MEPIKGLKCPCCGYYHVYLDTQPDDVEYISMYFCLVCPWSMNADKFEQTPEFKNLKV